MSLRRFGRVTAISILFLGAFLFIRGSIAGLNWTAVWLAPRTPVVMNIAETRPYAVMGLNGANVKTDLTRSRSSSPPGPC